MTGHKAEPYEGHHGMIDPDRIQPKISPLDVWRIGASFIFIGFGIYFIGAFLLSLVHQQHRPFTTLLLGGLILLYGGWRLWSGWRNYKRMRQMRGEERLDIDQKQ